ncbi:unnamed protein product [Closterium sp. Naga37s-1]|nr:unnamed protein product [Closterium sp. Naga37s-1]
MCDTLAIGDAAEGRRGREEEGKRGGGTGAAASALLLLICIACLGSTEVKTPNWGIRWCAAGAADGVRAGPPNVRSTPVCFAWFERGLVGRFMPSARASPGLRSGGGLHGTPATVVGGGGFCKCRSHTKGPHLNVVCGCNTRG